MIRYVFGPVPSRRLGISLGIDITPFKTCSLDCIYCECGQTTELTTERSIFVPADLVLAEIRKTMAALKRVDFLTFSGSGEPTLHLEIGRMISTLKAEFPFPVAVLTNGTLFSDPEVRRQLAEADLILPSLDAVSEKAFKAINRPHRSLQPREMVNGLAALRRECRAAIWLEVFIVKGINDNDRELDLLAEAITQIKPDRVQLNSLDRPPAVRGTAAPSMAELERIRQRWSSLPTEVEIIKRVRSRDDVNAYSLNLENSLLNTLRRRPLTLADLARLTSMHQLEIRKYLDLLEQDGLVYPEISEDKIFFRARDRAAE